MEEARALAQGKIGVIPTDTLYGVVALARDVDVVARVYALKRRDPSKSCIVLIDSIDRLVEFGIVCTVSLREQLARHWPGPVSIILPSTIPEFAHLQRGNESIAFRVPDDVSLREFLRASGPLIAPSANREGEVPATTLAQAREYFGDGVDIYIDGGERSGLPSRLISISADATEVILRDGR